MSISTQTHVGPHEGRELELMLAGEKPLSMFVEPLDSTFEYLNGRSNSAAISLLPLKTQLAAE